jgi:hypothetical protein
MNDLLQLAVNAHGGIDRWNKLTWVDTDLSMSGAIWSVKGKPDVFRQVHLTAKLHSRTHDGPCPASSVAACSTASARFSKPTPAKCLNAAMIPKRRSSPISMRAGRNG